MKKTVFICLALVSVFFISCKDNAAAKVDASKLEAAKERDSKNDLGYPEIEFDQTVYDFGTIKEGEVVDGIFKVKNTGKVDLIITGVKPSCGCTTPDWTKKPIAPGESGEIKFSFNSKGRVGKQNKSITIKANTEKITQVIRIKGEVTKAS